MLIRPLLGWRKDELVKLVADAGLTPVDDPSNRDPRHDRSRIRKWLAGSEWADPARLAVSASAIRDADEALDWALAPLIGSRIKQDGGALLIEPFDLPRELKRRLLLAAFAELGAAPPRGPDLIRALEALERGETVTLSDLKLEGGSHWRLSLAPPRRRESCAPVTRGTLRVGLNRFDPERATGNGDGSRRFVPAASGLERDAGRCPKHRHRRNLAHPRDPEPPP